MVPKSVLRILLLALTAASCETGLTGEKEPNLPPRTFLLTDRIERVAQDRFSSQVSVAWWADDPDGFVTAYEWNVGDTVANPWRRTLRTDSTFLLPMGSATDSADVAFYVRAIDNLQLRDPSPARLVYPIRNSPPVLKVTASERPPDTTYQFFSVAYSVSDVDGASNIARVQFSINSRTGPWQDLDRTISLLSFRTNADGSAQLLTGNQMTADPRSLTGFVANGANKVYFRAEDITGARSAPDSISFFMKIRTSRVLALNDLIGPNRYSRFASHLAELRAQGITSIDFADITDGNSAGGAKVPRSAAFPQSRTSPALLEHLAQWSYIYWVTDDVDRNLTYAPEMLVRFFTRGGKLFVTTPVKRLNDTQDPVLTFLSIGQIMPLPSGATGFRVPPIGGNNQGINPVAPYTGPAMSTASSTTNILPLKPLTGATAVYNADFKTTRIGSAVPVEYPPVGLTDFSEAVAIRNPDGNIILFGMDLLTINRDANLGALLRRLCIEDLGFRHN